MDQLTRINAAIFIANDYHNQLLSENRGRIENVIDNHSQH